MPQLIAMVIVVVGAMIYMFQTFGGTGDKIEGIAQKTSVITEINNIKNGLQLAVRSGDVSVTTVTATDGTVTGGATTLADIAKLEYFADQINDEVKDNSTTATTNGGVGEVNTYSAISFGGEGENTDNENMLISLVLPASATAADTNARPGLFVDLSRGNLSQNAAFLEAQLVSDLAAVATIDRKANGLTYNTNLDAAGDIATADLQSGGTDSDGMFTIYFKDIRAGMIE